MLGQRRRRWPNIETTLGNRPVFAGIVQMQAAIPLPDSALQILKIRQKTTNNRPITQRYPSLLGPYWFKPRDPDHNIDPGSAL